MSAKPKIEVWMHKKTGQLWEHLPTSLGGYGLASVDIDNLAPGEFTDWRDFADRKLFLFDDEPFYKPENFENLGEL
jgi:hypothetical protein